MTRKLKNTLRKFDKEKENKPILISGELGIPLNGTKTVEVPNRRGFVFVRLKGNTSELIQAYNASVSPIYGLPVLVGRQGNVYKVVGRNLDRYQDWGNTPYLPKHGSQHSFNHELGIGGDITWIFSQQFMPLLNYPSGTNGGMTLSLEPHFYEWNGQWRYAQNTGTPSYTPYLPTVTGSARMVLSYIDPVDNSVKLVPGTPFSGLLTGSADIAQYIPDIPREVGLPLSAVRLTTGTTSIGWDAIYDLRDFYTVGKPSGSAGGAGGGSFGFVGWDEGVFLATGTVLNVTGAGATLSVSGTVFNLSVPGGGGGGGSLGIVGKDEGVYVATGTILNVTGEGATLTASGTTLILNVPGASGTSPNHSYFQYLSSMLEPDAIEMPKFGAFSYPIASGTTKLLYNAYYTSIDGSKRLDVRNPPAFLALSDLTLTGLNSGAFAHLINPGLASYTDARDTYYDRLGELMTMKLRVVGSSGTASVTALPGPYGIIMANTTMVDYAWVGIAGGGTAIGFNSWNEINDTDTLRVGNNHFIPFSKMNMTRTSVSNAGTSYAFHWYILPSTWSKVTDSLAPYDWRDDFMDSSLNTATKWARTQSAAGNIEIDTTFQWCKVIGNGSWGSNGAYGQTGFDHSSGKIFICDVYVPIGIGAGNVNTIVGWHDGGGHSYTDFAHGLDFTENAGRKLWVFENGNSRGAVGSGYSEGVIYRVKITLAASSAVYEIQSNDGTYGTLGSNTWTDITPGTTSSSTTPIYPGISRESSTGVIYVSDVKIT